MRFNENAIIKKETLRRTDSDGSRQRLTNNRGVMPRMRLDEELADPLYEAP